MELPHIGKHCSEDNCRQLDFLPVKCDECSKVFCGEHYAYTKHNCPGAYKKNVQVPVCPLCNAPVPGKLNELPDIRVSRHIDADCKSDTAMSRRQKVYTNRCNFKGCKQKEMIPILCDKCNLNYCLKHRHQQDHACDLIKQSGKPLGKAGLSRNHPSSSTKSHTFSSHISNATSSMTNGFNRVMGFRPAALQGNVSEDEAFQIALQASLNPSSSSGNVGSSNKPHLSQEQEDFLLAKAIAESEQEATMAGGASSRQRRSQPNCEIS